MRSSGIRTDHHAPGGHRPNQGGATSRRIAGDEAFAMGLADLLMPQEQVRSLGIAARYSALSAPNGFTKAKVSAIRRSICGLLTRIS